VSTFQLPGIRTATTARHEALIARAVEVFESDSRILAAYLVGGFAVGQGDAFSDVDLQCIVSEEAVSELRTSWRDVASAIGQPVHVQPFGPIMGGLFITADWLHFDIVFNPVGSVDPKTVEGMIPLVDKAELLPPAAVPRPDRRGEPFFPRQIVEDFFLYMLGNVVSAVGRHEPIPATNGVVMMRDIGLVSLLLAEQGLATTREHTFGNPFPFTKRLRTYLTAEQNSLLDSLPPIEVSVESAIHGFVALAEAFLPRAKRLADSTGAQWPTKFERATVDYFETMIGVTLAL
jgi:hypothetical protein